MYNRNKLSFSLTFFFMVFLFSCSQKERVEDISPNLLVGVRLNTPVLNIGDKSIKEVVEKELANKFSFQFGDIYEMEMGEYCVIKQYNSQNDYNNNKMAVEGSYFFEKAESRVTFSFEGNISYSIDGPFGDIFYNHFVRKEGAGEHHVVDNGKVFCLHEDLTNYFQNKYPTANIELAAIKTDMITLRRLETIKVLK